MAKVAEAMESSELINYDFPKKNSADEASLNAAVLAKKNHAAIAVFSPQGLSAKAISQARINCPIFAFSDSKNVLRKLSLLQGVTPLFLKGLVPGGASASRKISDSMAEILKEKGYAAHYPKMVFVLTKANKKGGNSSFRGVEKPRLEWYNKSLVSSPRALFGRVA